VGNARVEEERRGEERRGEKSGVEWSRVGRANSKVCEGTHLYRTSKSTPESGRRVEAVSKNILIRFSSTTPQREPTIARCKSEQIRILYRRAILHYRASMLAVIVKVHSLCAIKPTYQIPHPCIVAPPPRRTRERGGQAWEWEGVGGGGGDGGRVETAANEKL